MRYALGGMAAALLVLIISPARAQTVQAQYNVTRRTVTLDADNAEIGRVVSTLFARVGGARYEMDPGVSGKVTVHLRDVSPDSALRSALGQVGATWEMRDGVYRIRSRSGTAPSGPGDRTSQRRSLRMEDVSLGQAAQQISSLYGQGVRVQGPLPGRVSLDLRNATYEEAVRALVSSANRGGSRVEARWTGDFYLIIPIESLPGADDVPAAFRVRVDVAATDRPIGEVTGVLSRKAGVGIRYDRDIPGDLRVSIMAKNEPFWTVVQRLAIAARLKAEITAPREITLRPLSSVSVDYRGRRIGSVTEDYGTCRHCNFRELKRGWRFCPMCGERLEVR